jgi:hypothetical protein
MVLIEEEETILSGALDGTVILRKINNLNDVKRIKC